MKSPPKAQSSLSLWEKEGLEGNVGCTDSSLSRWERVRVRGRKMDASEKSALILTFSLREKGVKWGRASSS